MRLSKLIPGIGHRRDPTITGLTADSRQVRPGYLFAALPGHQADGRNFIPDAVARGDMTSAHAAAARYAETP